MADVREIDPRVLRADQFYADKERLREIRLRLSDETSLVVCSVYVNLKSVRAKMESAVLDLHVLEVEDAGEILRATPVAKLQKQQAKKKRNQTERKVARGVWLAPLAMSQSLAANPEIHADGLRCSDRGFLNLTMKDYAACFTGRLSARQ